MGGTPINTPPFLGGSGPATPTGPSQTLTPQQLDQLRQVIFGNSNPAAGMPASQAQPQQQATPGVTPLGMPGPEGAPRSGVGAPAPVTQIPGRQQAQPSAMLGSNFSFPNKSARNGAVVATGIENLSAAIHTFKTQKEQKQFQQAKTTWDLYQKAAQVDPQTGQPVDPHTMAILGQDPKVIKLWEKYITGELPRDPVSGSPTPDPTKGPVQPPKKGAPAGRPMIPQPSADPQAMLQSLQAQRQLQALRSNQPNPGQLTPDEEHQAALIKAGLQPSAKDLKDFQKIDADMKKAQADSDEATQRTALMKRQLESVPLEDNLKRQEANKDLHEAMRADAEAKKALDDLGKAKSESAFKTVSSGVDKIVKDAGTNLAKMQKTAMDSRSKFGKAFGGAPDVTPEQDAAQAKLLALQDMRANILNMHDDVINKKITPNDALTQARRDAGLTTTYDVWGGMPDKAPDAKKLPDGTGYPSPDGEVLGIVQDGKWVAP